MAGRPDLGPPIPELPAEALGRGRLSQRQAAGLVRVFVQLEPLTTILGEVLGEFPIPGPNRSRRSRKRCVVRMGRVELRGLPGQPAGRLPNESAGVHAIRAAVAAGQDLSQVKTPIRHRRRRPAFHYGRPEPGNSGLGGAAKSTGGSPCRHSPCRFSTPTWPKFGYPVFSLPPLPANQR